MPSQTRYVLVETLLSVVINTALSILFVFLAFHGRAQIATLGQHGIVLDMAPQTFMITLMSSLVPGLLTRTRLRAGALGRERTPAASAGRICRTALALALLASCVVAGICWLTLPHLLPGGAAFGSLLPGKAVYGALLAAVVTPWTVVRVLRSGGR